MKKNIDFYEFSHYSGLIEVLGVDGENIKDTKKALADNFGLSLDDLDVIAKALRAIDEEEDDRYLDPDYDDLY